MRADRRFGPVGRSASEEAVQVNDCDGAEPDDESGDRKEDSESIHESLYEMSEHLLCLQVYLYITSRKEQLYLHPQCRFPKSTNISHSFRPPKWRDTPPRDFGCGESSGVGEHLSASHALGI